MTPYDLQTAQAFFAARTAFTTGVHELEVLMRQNPRDVVIVDVRMPSDFSQGHVPGAINLPKGEWQDPLRLRKNATHYVYCYDQTCHMASEAALEFARQGYRVVEVEGGWERWQSKGFRSETATQVA